MKKTRISLLALMLALVMVVGAFASCGNNDGEKATEATSQATTSADTSAETTAETTTEEQTQTTSTETQTTSTETQPSATETETNTTETENVTSESDTSETETTDTTDDEESSNADLAGEHAALIELNNSMANGVQSYFTDGSRNYFNFTNKNMTMSYARSNALQQQVAYIVNTNGNAYIQNTMDVFIRMTDGSVHYASNSTKSAEANIYRFGYYYYEGLFEFQNFVPKNFEIDVKDSPKVGRLETFNHMVERENAKGGALKFTITDGSDPYITFRNFSYSSEEVNTVTFTATATSGVSNCTIFIGTDTLPLAQNTSMNIQMYGDGQPHTYSVDLTAISGYSGNLTQFRIDPAGVVGDSITISELSFGYADLSNVPADVSINRHFHVYTDKMHQAIQFATTKETTDIAELGMITEIPTDTVAKLLVLDANGEHTSLEGVDWASAYAVAFDIKDAGIFGYILPVHETAGTISVTEENGNYVILQTRVPTDNKLIPSISGEVDKNGNHTHAAGVTNNGNDFYISQRIYTDEAHDFEAFLFETYIERNPIAENQVKIGEESDSGSFGGYDPVRGIYILNIGMPLGSFSGAYNNPQKNYRVNFTIAAGKQISRNIYIMTAGKGGILECAVLLDADNMMLPIPIEVIKNFSEATGERNLFNIGDPTFSEAIFMLNLEAGEKYEYNILNIYQNWGNYPLKQLSSIPFHCPYYHLSTGVTETNCIVPWYNTAGFGRPSNTLPDFRSMSAPFWQTQPQHNSCGTHTWLRYTDSEGGTYLTESTKQTITSYGPTYAELIWENITDDGKIKVTYTHMEMPQTDENRTYYTMEYEFLEDLTINSFKDNFQFYNVTDNNHTGTYKKLGYLNEQNECVVIDTNQDATIVPEYVLGNQCPYFSLFMMPDWDRGSDSAEGYANLAFLIYNSDFVIGGEAKDYSFLIKNSKDHVTLTLNETGTVEFKAGDKITINAILMPWGSQQYEDDPANRLDKQNATEYTDITYSTVLEDGSLYMDKNVRDVRENTLLDPLTVTSETDEIIESAFLPKVKSADGKTATFTLSGGYNNVTVRVYGFDLLTAPRVEELVGGNWVEYKINSADNPINGYYHYYDGYSVQYDGDGTYSYSFVVTMQDAPRTFRVYADKEFEGWPEEILPEGGEDFLKVYVDPSEMYESSAAYKNWFGSITDNQDYITFTGSNSEDLREAYFNAYGGSAESGEYFVIKYRVPSTSATFADIIEVYISTQNSGPTAGDNFSFTPIRDGEWHIAVVNVAKSKCGTFTPDADGKYYTKYIRVDVFNKVTPTDVAMDIAFVGMDSSLEEICKLAQDEFATIDYYEGSSKTDLDTFTYEPYVKHYIDPNSGYKEAENAIFATQLDYVNHAENPTLVTFQTSSKADSICIANGYNSLSDGTFTISGWCVVANGGVSKYVWSADGGKTWNEIAGPQGFANDDMTKALNSRNGLTLTAEELNNSKANGNFQGSGIAIDLSAYAGKKIDLTIAAIPASSEEQNELILLYCFEKLTVRTSSDDPDTGDQTTKTIMYASTVDYVNKDISNLVNKSANTYSGTHTFEGFDALDNKTLSITGWCVVYGGLEKMVWSTDGGETWNDCTGILAAAGDALVDAFCERNSLTLTAQEIAATKTNGSFQGGSPMTADLSAHAGETVEVIFAAVPVLAEDGADPITLYIFKDVSVPN